MQAEEEMRLLHERKLRLLKRLDDKGAEDDKINAAQAKVKKLATRIGVAIQVVDSISRKVSALRDEELWPQLNGLILGYTSRPPPFVFLSVDSCHGRRKP